MSGRPDMAAFWDERARENAAYFIENQLDYRRPDMERFWKSGPPVVDAVLETVGAPPIRPTDVVVEIGCGIGRLTRPLAERAHAVYALDVSAEMLERARTLNPQLDGVRWVRSDGVSLAPVADGEADVVFSHVVFQHIPDPAVTLGYVREIGRVLRPGGWAAIQVSNDPSIHRPRRSAPRRRAAAILRRSPRGQDHPAWLGSAVSLEDLRAAATDGGLAIERTAGEGTQFCFVLLRSRGGGQASS